MSQFNLFSCHKYLEQSGARLLFNLAQCDSDDKTAIDDIGLSMSQFARMLKGHASWEEHFVFKWLPTEAVSAEISHHQSLDQEINAIQKELATVNLRLHLIYLRYRKFYSQLLEHLHEEETVIMDLLRERLSDQELRQIDHEIYKQMSANDMIDMVNSLLPPCNYEEKVAVLEDLKQANLAAFEEAWDEIALLFSDQERSRILF